MRGGRLAIALLTGTAAAGVTLAARTRAHAQRVAAERERLARELDETRKETREALFANEVSFRSLVSHIPGAIYRCAYDEDWTAYFLSDAIEAIVGYPASDFLGSSVRSLGSIVHPEDRPALQQAVRDAVSDLRPYILEYRMVHADGRIRWIYEKGQAIVDDDGSVQWLDGALFDVTERKLLEERLGQSARLEAVGRLAGGIAHDFNNLLTAISGYAQLLQDRVDPESSAHRDAREISRAAGRATELTAQLLAFGRRQVLQPTVLDLKMLVRDLSAMLRRLIGEDVELALDLAGDSPLVRADPGQIEQVIVNLVVNARDAMPDGGRLTIATAEDVDPALGDVITLRVTDTGTGMDEMTLAHAFEPFFTTKETGKGTGLGLATVYGIVVQSGGSVHVESAPGVGSTFTVVLPRAEGAPAVVQAPPERRAKARRGDETILLVEDEQAVRSLAQEVLEDYGYTVLEATNGGEALSIAALYDGTIHLLLTDVVMPELGGLELAQLLAPTRPDLKVLFMSGYTDELAGRRIALRSGEEFLPKPFTPEVLARTVRAVLDGRRLHTGEAARDGA